MKTVSSVDLPGDVHFGLLTTSLWLPTLRCVCSVNVEPEVLLWWKSHSTVTRPRIILTIFGKADDKLRADVRLAEAFRVYIAYFFIDTKTAIYKTFASSPKSLSAHCNTNPSAASLYQSAPLSYHQALEKHLCTSLAN